MLSHCSNRALAAFVRNASAANNATAIHIQSITTSSHAASDRRDAVKSLTSEKILFEKNVHVPSLGGTLSVRTPLNVKVSQPCEQSQINASFMVKLLKFFGFRSCP